MPSRQRKFDVHILTISGLEAGTGYGSFLRKVRRRVPSLADAVQEIGSKSHALHSIHVFNNRTRLRFLSYTTGHRPDVIDTEDFSIEPNPLDETQTGIEWTHALGCRKQGVYYLVIEKVQSGIFPKSIATYLQWLVDEFDGRDEEDDDSEPIVVNIEPDPGEEFIERLNALGRVTRALVRIPRPNPGWSDLEDDLAEQAGASDARVAEVAMTARRRQSLSRNGGIVGAIKRLFRERQLRFAAIEGERNGVHESFNSERLIRSARVEIELDERGQLNSADAWAKMNRIMNEI